MNTMNIYAKKGDKVIFLQWNGRESDLEYAIECGLVKGKCYTVERTEVGGWSTDVYLQEFPNCPFNSVMFRDVSNEGERYES